MTSPHCDVIIVGAGAAGLTAAIGLARSGFRVAVVEAAAFAGAENWSGCVYFAENLAHPDILGPEGVEALAWERRLVERGFFATDGHGLLGMKYRDPSAFRHCYTVLRPIYDHHLAQFALRHGVQLLTSTTAESLIREQGRVIGVCTNRGALYAKLVFLAEGDASNLVTREGYERLGAGPRPKFLQGIKQVLELPPRAIEQRFGVEAEQGVAYEMLLRNGTLHGKSVHLNMGGFVYTNRQGLSVGLVLPADHLHEHFEGDPNLLLEWFLHLPSLRPWFEGARQGAFGAKLIRGGGIKDVPTLIDDGLVIGGAASGIGIDFPFPNFTGPATAMGLLITHGARKIRDEGGSFTRDELDRHYLQPLRKTHYWRDVEFLRDWPGYVKKTSYFFGENVDFALGIAYLWTRPAMTFGDRLGNWLQLVRHVVGRENRAAVDSDLHDFRAALRIHESVTRPSPWRLLLDAALNTTRDLTGQPRALPTHGTVSLHYSVAGGAEPSGLPPQALRRWWDRFAPAIASAARVVYNNDSMPLARKLPFATRLVTRHVSLADLARALGLGLTAGARWLFGSRDRKPKNAEYFDAARAAVDLTPVAASAAAAWDSRLAQLGYETAKASHIHVEWPQSIAHKYDVTRAGLWHVCPAHVYEARVSATGQLQIVVNFENCIKCETCWRTSDMVDWGRDGAHRFVYAVQSPAMEKLLADMGGKVGSQLWAVGSEAAIRERRRSEEERLLAQLERKLIEFDEALSEEPRTIGRDRAAHLAMLVRYAHQMALQLASVSRDPERSAGERGATPLLIDEFLALTERRMERVEAGRFAWAAGDGRQMRFHHLARLGRQGSLGSPSAPSRDQQLHELRNRLDAAFPANVWRELEQQRPLTAEQNAVLREVVNHISALDASRPGLSVNRMEILSHLARRDPSLAYGVASHLWERELAKSAGGQSVEAPAIWPATQVKTLGLRGAALVRSSLDGMQQSSPDRAAESSAPQSSWERFTAFDLAASALGMADYLCERAIEHAAGRVQFPGLFHDEESQEAIGKFGAIKKMLAEMAAGREIIRIAISAMESSHVTDAQASALKAVVGELLGTAPGSVTYNAGQVFGGTGYSEDDTLSKLYRDASAWRFLGVPNSEAFASHGAALLEDWTADGVKLSRLPDEESVFAEIKQRQALARELDGISRHAASLAESVNAWRFADEKLPTVHAQAAFVEAVGRQDAFLLCSKLLLARMHNDMEGGCGTEADVALLRTWMNKVRADFDGFTVFVGTLRASNRSPFPPVAYASGSDVTPGSPITQYAEFLRADLPYSSGDFLSKPTDPTQPRYVPELVGTDEFLAKRNIELIDLIQGQFGQPRNGMVYERYLETRHRPDTEDLEFLRDQGLFRMQIPKELGGEGRSKADYYLLVVNTHRLADAAISLTIQVNSSLGTTPVLLARDKDLPRAIKDAKDDATRDELNRRREACDLFCRWVASGQISAFALTEPSAGSDTARVATRARLRQAPVEMEPDGVYSFLPVGGKERRRLLDSRGLSFSFDDARPQAAYDSASICFDEYDYETDACKKRYFVSQGRKVYFDDIAQLRERDGKLWYDYWELSGAKMWITNGRIMGLACLYAKTDKGVTGFMVDRHAEGLIVGKDEAKMGQNGSPTNELSLQAVRVPRENVIGLEGRGQVNALETLNVGRAGLAMSAMCQMVRLCDWSRQFAMNRYREIPAWIGWRLECMEAERFIAEAMAHEIIGRFEHKQTKSIRMESAIGKMLVSELYHHSIELAEEIHGLEGQTQEHLIEKRKRDARVLNIYEGTNEIQRFLILKELTELAAGWPPHPQPLSPKPGRGENEVDSLKARLRQLTTEAVAFFGQQLWQNPNLQARCFVLSEAAAWLAAAESTLGRLTWLARKGDADSELMSSGNRALVRCLGEIETRLQRFTDDLADLRGGHYGPEIRAGSLLLRQKETPKVADPKDNLTRPFSVLVVLDAPTPGVPHPHVQAGRLMEPYRVLTEGDRAALETALRLRDAGEVRIEIVMVASTAAGSQLRETINLGVDRVRLITSAEPVSPDRAAAALSQVLVGEAAFDLVLGGAGAADGQEGLCARLTAEALGLPFAGSAARLAVNTADNSLRLLDSDGQTHVRSLSSSVLIEPGLTLRPFTIDGWLHGLRQEVEIVPWPNGVTALPIEFEEAGSVPSSSESAPGALQPREASRLILDNAGIECASRSPAKGSPVSSTIPAIVDAASPFFARQGGGPVILAVLATDADGKLHSSARHTLDAAQFLTPFFGGADKAVLVVVPTNDLAQQRALSELAALTPFDLCLLAVAGAVVSDEIRCRVLVECMSGLEKFPAAVVGEPWTESALATLAAASGALDPVALRVRLLDRHQGRLMAEGGGASGKLRTRQTLNWSNGQTVWIGLNGEAEIGAAMPAEQRPARRVERWSPQLNHLYGREDMQRLLQELKQDAGLVRLTDAEFIIDVGFGVANRDGYEAVIQPLETELRRLGVRGLTVGGSRKVTEELRLLPADRQIGQSGVTVNPRVLLAIGISGAPQHLNYIGARASIVAFNRDPDAPLMTLNQRQARPKVYPVIGDLFETVPAMIACLREESGNPRETINQDV